MIKKSLITLFLLIAGCFAGAQLLPAWLQWQGDSYATDAVNAMSDKWDAEELDSRAHPVMLELLQKSNQTSDQYFQVMRRLGKHKSTECNAMTLAVFSVPQTSVSAAYRCDMLFSTGPAALTLELRKPGMFGGWKIASLNVDSAIFLKDAPPAAKPHDTEGSL